MDIIVDITSNANRRTLLGSLKIARTVQQRQRAQRVQTEHSDVAHRFVMKLKLTILQIRRSRGLVQGMSSKILSSCRKREVVQAMAFSRSKSLNLHVLIARLQADFQVQNMVRIVLSWVVGSHHEIRKPCGRS